MFNTLEIEKSVLNLLVIGDHQADMFRKVHQGLFSTCRTTFLKIKDEFNLHGKLDAVILQKALTPYELDLVIKPENQPREENFNRYVKILETEKVRSSLLKLAEELKESKPCLEVVQKMKRLAEESLSETSSQTLMDLSVEVVEYVKHYDPSKKISSNFPSLDSAINGFYPGEVYIFGARTNVGKTNFAVNLSVNIAKAGKGALLFSSEMSGRKITQDRLFPVVTKMSANDFRKNETFKDNFDALIPLIGQKVNLPISICDKRRPELSDLDSLAVKVNPSIIIVDHLHRCKLPHAESLRHSMKEFMIGCKDIATDRGIPIVLMAQVSRDVEKTQNQAPLLSDLSESKSIEEEADVVCMMWKDSKVIDPVGKKLIQAYVAKNRNGFLKRFTIGVDSSNLIMSEYNG